MKLRFPKLSQAVIPVGLCALIMGFAGTAPAEETTTTSQGAEAGAAVPEPLNSPFWPKRVGKIGYTEAVKRLGSAQKTVKNKDGSLTAIWENQVEYKSAKQFPQNTGVDGLNNSVTTSPDSTGVISFKTERLTLAFDASGLLKSWNYKKP
jgi:hypothetical protein